jgi:hypothetical protein
MGMACNTHERNDKSIQNVVGEPEERRQFWHLLVDERIILEWILKEQHVRVWTGFVWIRIGSRG